MCSKMGVINGCAVARSNEAKALGVRMATPWFQIKDLAKTHGLVALSSNYTLYGDMSNRVMAVLRNYSPQVTTEAKSFSCDFA